MVHFVSHKYLDHHPAPGVFVYFFGFFFGQGQQTGVAWAFVAQGCMQLFHELGLSFFAPRGESRYSGGEETGRVVLT